MSSTAEFFEGAVKSGTMILISEIGDKTFFIAAIMAMRHSRATVFAGAVGALRVWRVCGGRRDLRVRHGAESRRGDAGGGGGEGMSFLWPRVKILI